MAIPVLRWSPTLWRKMEALRDKMRRSIGTDEPFFEERYGPDAVAMQWRWPLRLDEVNQMAPTSAVRLREGRA